jgi:energy-coupling factor transport system ATP-binding protein
VALILTDVTCDYAPRTPLSARALDAVSFVLKPGSLAVVLGPTGSGKTTLLRAAAGLVGLSSGSVEVDGRPVTGPDSVKGSVGLVFQRPESQFFALSVAEDCAFGPRNLGRTFPEAEADARQALASVGLDPDEFGPREPWSLSGGEARRAALAGVLAMRPRYLLLDEPTAGLDVAGREAVCAAISEIARTAGVLVVTHDPEIFLGMADEVLVLRAGRTVFEGDVSGLLAALPALSEPGVVEAPEVARALLLAARRSGTPMSELTLDPDRAAELLAARAPGTAGAR